MSSTKDKTQANSKQIVVSNESEYDRLVRDIYRPDMEKFQLFMQMLRNNAKYKNVKVSHRHIINSDETKQ